jgi:lipopolysaccharide exporter
MADQLTGTGRVVIRNAVWVTLFSNANQLVGLVVGILLTRILPKDAFGLFALGSFWVSLLGISSKFSLGSAAIRMPRLDGELLGTYFALELTLALASLVVSCIAAVILLRLGYAFEVALILVVLTATASAATITAPYNMVLEREIQLSRLSLLGMVATFISSGVAIGLGLAGAGVWSLLSMPMITAVVGTVGVYWVCRRRLPHVLTLRWTFSFTLAKQLIQQGLAVGFSDLALTTIVGKFDNFLIGTYVNPTTLSYYDRAFRISNWPNVLLNALLGRIGFLTFAKVQNDLARLTQAMRWALWILTTFGFPLGLMLFFGAPDVIELLYTVAWAPSSFFLRFLAIYSILMPFTGLGTSLATALGHRRAIVALSSIQAAIMIIACTPLTFWLGAAGTLIGVEITFATGFGLGCAYIFKRLPLLSPLETFGRPLIAAGIAVATSGLVIHLPGWANLHILVRLFLVGLSAPGTYLAALFALNPKDMLERSRYLINTFRNRQGAPLT